MSKLKTNIGKPTFIIEEGLKKDYPNLEKLLSLMDIQYLTKNHPTLGESCPILVSEVIKLEDYKREHGKIGFFPTESSIDSIWYGGNIRRAIKNEIIDLGLAYDAESKYGSNIRYLLTKNNFKRLLNGLNKFPESLEIGVYLQLKIGKKENE